MWRGGGIYVATVPWVTTYHSCSYTSTKAILLAVAVVMAATSLQAVMDVMAALAVLQASMFRLLTSLPPGQVRFTIVDPIGIGRNFGAFMHLADFDGGVGDDGSLRVGDVAGDSGLLSV